MLKDELKEQLKRRLKGEEKMMDKARRNEDWALVRLCQECIRKLKYQLQE